MGLSSRARRILPWTLALLTLLPAAAISARAADESGMAPRRAFLYEATDRWWLDTSMAMGMLQDPYPETRTLAARVLAVNPTPERLRLLEEYAEDTSAATRQQVMLAAGRLGRAGLGLALAGLRDRVPAVRQAAAWAVCQAGGGRGLEELAHLLLVERDEPVLETALANLWRFSDALWEPHVARYATHTDPLLRRAAAYSLARSTSPRRTAALLVLARDAEPVIRATAVSGLIRGPLSDAEQGALLTALVDEDWRVRVAACRALAAHPERALPEAAGRRLAELWTDDRAQLAVAALGAAAAHPEAGDDATLERLLTEAEPWPAAAALAALAGRGAPEAAARVGAWLVGGQEEWRRRAAGRAIPRLAPGTRAPLEARALADPAPAVRLAWLEALPPEQVADHVEVLWGVVDGDADPAVRALALEDLRGTGAVTDVDRALALARAWRGDDLPDARATALAAALAAAGTAAQRKQVRELAAADPNPAVGAIMAAAARREGVPVVLPARPARHGGAWYRDLVRWADEEHWLDVVTVRGTFRIRLDSERAPVSCREVWGLAEEGFYENLDFHRVVPDFVVQGGDPRGDGWGGPGFVLADEPSLVPFDSWRVGLATSGPNTGGSQLFVTLLPADHLTGHYTNLGEVVAGRDVLTRLEAGDRILRVETASGSEPPPPDPVLRGDLAWEELAAVPGWEAERAAYEPDEGAVRRLRTASGSYTVLAVLGSWCSDSRREVPRLEKVLAQVGGDHFQLRLVGVDRTRRVSDPGVAAVLGARAAERVPTIVVTDADGQELGRVVETAEQPLEQLLVAFLAPVEGW